MASGTMYTLLLTADFPPMTGGVAQWMAELVRRWPPGEIGVLTGRLEGSAETDPALAAPVERIAVPVARLRTLPGILRWQRAARRLAADRDVAFCWCDTIRPAGYVGRHLLDRLGVPYGILVHGDDLVAIAAKASRSRWKRRVARRLLGGAAVIVANSEWTAERARAVLGALGLEANRERVRAVPLGSDPARFAPAGRDDAAVRLRYGLDGRRWLVTVARLVPYKGIDRGLRALAALGRERPDLGYLVVGSGPDRARLEALAGALGLADRVRFLGRVPAADLPALYRAAVLYLGLSRSSGVEIEGFGIALADAAASGLAVVAGRGGGTADAVADGVTGLLVDPEDQTAIDRTVASLLDDEARRRALGQAGRRRIERELNWDRAVGALVALSRRAAATPARS